MLPPVEDIIGKESNGVPEKSDQVTLDDLRDSTEVKESLIGRVGIESDRKTILVTGGAGYIGSHLVRKALRRDYNVRVLDNFTYGRHGLEDVWDHPNLEIIEGDIANIRDVVQGVKGVDSVIALAAIVGDPACGINAEETLNMNYESTKIITEACDFYGVDRLVFASSCSVYGAKGDGYITEESALNPVSLYARTRILSEDIIFDRCGDVVPVVLRLATAFGLSHRMRFDLVVNTLTVRGIADGSFQIFGGDQWRPFVHCQDAADAFLMAAVAPEEQVGHEVFNVGSNSMNYQIQEVGEVVNEELESADMETIDSVEDERNYRVKFDKIMDRTDWRPSYDLRSGIQEMADAIRSDPSLQDYQQPIYSNVQILEDRIDPETVEAKRVVG
jgi:nucleoside-diphosphate-sugar epimerase